MPGCFAKEQVGSVGLGLAGDSALPTRSEVMLTPLTRGPPVNSVHPQGWSQCQPKAHSCHACGKHAPCPAYIRTFQGSCFKYGHTVSGAVQGSLNTCRYFNKHHTPLRCVLMDTKAWVPLEEKSKYPCERELHAGLTGLCTSAEGFY